jgi:hypothetical protein
MFAESDRYAVETNEAWSVASRLWDVGAQPLAGHQFVVISGVW